MLGASLMSFCGGQLPFKYIFKGPHYTHFQTFIFFLRFQWSSLTLLTVQKTL